MERILENVHSEDQERDMKKKKLYEALYKYK
jgi:hypothetical protein